MTMATGEAPAEVASTELPEIVKTVQEAVRILPLMKCALMGLVGILNEFVIGGQWDKVEDKYAVSSLVVAGGVALWGSTGLISVSCFSNWTSFIFYLLMLFLLVLLCLALILLLLNKI